MRFFDRVDDSLSEQTEDILGRLKRWGDQELSEEGFLLFLSSLEAQGGDLSCSAVDLMVIIAVGFASEDLAGLVDELDVFPGAGSPENKVIVNLPSNL
jgi:hypothetical protein